MAKQKKNRSGDLGRGKKPNPQSNKIRGLDFWVFATTIFISALLVFQVQPIIARFILPWFGGNASVWSACLLFFQVGLLLGYGYAYGISRYLRVGQQLPLHMVLLFLSLLWLPIVPSSSSLQGTAIEHPVISILWLLTTSVGLPYILLSSTGPLLQHWFAQRFQGRSPYRLYSLSNIGSIIGLLIYPFLIEPNFGLAVQARIWEVCYGLTILFCGGAAWSLYRYKHALKSDPNPVLLDQAETDQQGTIPYNQYDPLLWLLLSACGSILLVSATNFISQDLAVVPFLWIVPLCLYLLTFILLFHNLRWYQRWFWLPALIFIIQPLLSHFENNYGFDNRELTTSTLVYLGAMFIGTMICHGELVRIKPSPKKLTHFYFTMALGSALGACLVTLVAPHVFTDYWEWPLGLMFSMVLLVVGYLRSPGLSFRPDEPIDSASPSQLRGVFPMILIFCLLQSLYLGDHILDFASAYQDKTLHRSRNFFGVLRVIEQHKGSPQYRKELFHGHISHGAQIQSQEYKHFASTYYSFESGVGLGILTHPKRLKGNGIKIGAVGLGIGTLVSYLKPQDKIVFYEINPEVNRVARTYFTFVPVTDNDQIRVVMGDARISLSREPATKESAFDILVIDAFTGDAIPVHLLTKEAMALYLARLNPQGILAFHISNQHFNLEPLIYHLAKAFSYHPVKFKSPNFNQLGVRASTWILLGKDPLFAVNQGLMVKSAHWNPETLTKKVIWTDDYSNLLDLLW